MKHLLRYLKGYEKEAVIGPLFKLLEACFELAVPLIMAHVIDTGIRSADTGYILAMGGVLVLLGALGLACSVTAQYFAAKAAFGFGQALRGDLFRHVMRLNWAQQDRVGASTLITRLTSDVDQTQAGLNLALRLFLRSPFIVAGALAASLWIDWRLGLVFLAATPVMALVIFGILRLTTPLYRAAQKLLDRLSLLTRENLAGVRVIRAFSRQSEETARFDAAADELRALQLRVGRIAALHNPLTCVLVNLAILVLLRQGAFAVDAGRISQGDLVALVNYMNQILLALVALATLLVSFSKGLASAGRVCEVLAEAPAFESPAEAPAPVSGAARVAFENVSFGYEGGEKELEQISFSALPGQTVGIIGGTGAGKSTLVNLIPRFYEASEGRVLVDGVDVRALPFARLRGRIGLVPQKARLFAGTVASNLRMRCPDAPDEALWAALETAQAADFVRALPQGLNSPVAQNGRNFSGGQRQRLCIARALVGSPDILILDDSASALDYATEAQLRRALAKDTSGRTTFLVSQRAASIRHADTILVLDDGRVIAAGTHDQLVHSCAVYRDICRSQHIEEGL
nr:ABC transporter ATP-binding protein [Anaerofilum sp. An201]